MRSPMITNNKQAQQRGVLASILIIIGFSGVFLSQTITDAQDQALQSINNLVKLSDQKSTASQIPLDYKSINTNTPPQEVESTRADLVKMTKLMEGDWIRTQSKIEAFNGMRVHFKTSSDGFQTVGVVTALSEGMERNFSIGEIKYKELRGAFRTGFYIQDKVIRNSTGDPYVETSLRISKDGNSLIFSSGSETLYTLSRIIQ